MNWDAIAAIGQTVSAFALVFVLLQLRHARQEVRRSISQGRSEGLRHLMLNQANQERLTALIQRANTALGGEPMPLASELIEHAGMSADEAMTVFWEQFAWWQYRSHTIVHVQELTHGERVEFDRGILGAYGHFPLGRRWFETMRASLDPDAVRYVESVLAQQPG